MTSEPCRIRLEGVRGIDFAMLLPPGDDLVTRAILHRGWWDLQTTNLAAAYLRPGDLVLDAGAHVGYFSMLFSRLVGPDGVVHAVEPNPASHALLRQNMILNATRNIVPWHLGLGARCGRAALVQAPGNSGAATLSPPSSLGEIRVQVETVDRLLATAAAPDLVKIDVQGQEDQVLSGMGASLSAGRERCVAIVEYHPGRLTPPDLAAHLGWLDRFGARLWDFERWEPRRMHLRRLSRSCLDQRMLDPSPLQEDFSVAMTFSDDATGRLARRAAAIGVDLQLAN